MGESSGKLADCSGIRIRIEPLVGDRVNAEAQRAMLLKNGERELELTLDLRQRASGHSGVQFCIDCNRGEGTQLIMRTAAGGEKV